ncbi:Cyclin-D1-binding protein 1-like protein [Gryllus bimaculatus]|nr:Cyclin-D1-binding protein 1-like protein [Gryllus bimaculatus]
MSEGNTLQAMLDNMNSAMSQLEDIAASSLSTEVTKVCILYSEPPAPSVQQVNDLLRKIETLYINMLKNFYNLPKEQGQVMRKKTQIALLKIVELLKAVFSSLKTKGAKGQKERMKLAGCVWESCEAIEHLPRDNLAATCAELDKELMLVEDALQEMEEEIKNQEDGMEGNAGDEIDNSERWSNQDCEIVPHCVALVKTARACMRRIKRAVNAQGRCSTEHEIAQLDDLISSVSRLSPSVDDFVSSAYPPMNRDAVKKTAMEVVNSVQAILLVVKQAHYVQDEDQSWVDFLLKAVDHNNNKLQPLLTV